MALWYKKTVLLICFSFLLITPSSSYGQFFEEANLEGAGDALYFGLPAAALTTSLLLKDYEGTWQFTKSAILNQGVTFTMKYLINKRRPFDGGDYAFPSGHTSTAFQSASFFHRRYGFKYSIPAYALAGLTAYSRLNAKKHDGWDILAGAIVGIGSTWFFTTPYQQERMELTFSGSTDSYLLGFRYTF